MSLRQQPSAFKLDYTSTTLEFSTSFESRNGNRITSNLKTARIKTQQQLIYTKPPELHNENNH
jgi:hypothetical protein